jgi:hypothetical protein
MKMVKSLLLGSAAGLVAIAGAQAADLPVKAKPVQYVKICSLYGAGFFYIPGTDTCLKVGGALRAEADFNANGSYNPYRSVNWDDPARNREVSRVRGYISVDARTQTQYGTLRGYINIAGMNTNSGSPASTGSISPGGNAYNVPYNPAMFLQFAGFTAGSTESFFTFDAQPYSNETPWWSSSSGGNGNPTFAYTAQFGNGFSATIAAEDTTGRQSNIWIPGVTVAPATGVTGNNGYGGRRWPDLVVNARLDQAWGGAQIMGALHDTYANYGGGVTDAATGYAIGVGAKFNLPSLGKGDYIQGQLAYMRGATNYIAVNSGFGGNTAVNLRDGFPAVVSSAVGPINDAVSLGAGNIELSKGWAFNLGYEHFWNTMWKTSLYGSYGKISYSAASSAVIAAAIGGGTAGSATWSSWNIGSRTTWTPVQNLDLSIDVMYTSVQTAFAGSVGPAAQGTYADKDFWAGIFRAQRNFWP